MDGEKIKTALWGAVGGGIALAIIGFAWGGWVTGGTARQMAEESAEEAVVARLAPICVERFNQDSEKDRKLEKLKEISSWERDDYVGNRVGRRCPVKRKPTPRLLESARNCLWDSAGRHPSSVASADPGLGFGFGSGLKN